MGRIELPTSFLPRKRSTTELHRQFTKWAGRDLHPRRPKPPVLQTGAFDYSATYPLY